MRLRLSVLLFAGTLVLGSACAHAQPSYEASLTRLLQHVLASDGRVHYDRLARGGSEKARLDSILTALERYPLTRLSSESAKKAFWINAYNVLMLDAVARQPGRTDVLGDDGGASFFKRTRTVGGLAVTLDQIEHVILRRQPGPAAVEAHRVARLDPRIHVALNCAAVSCPRLRPAAFTPTSLETQLEAGMREFANSPRHFSVQNERVRVSSLLDWFGDDFDQRMPAGSYILRYVAASHPDADALRRVLAGKDADALRALSTGTTPTVEYTYDWTVNRASPHR